MPSIAGYKKTYYEKIRIHFFELTNFQFIFWTKFAMGKKQSAIESYIAAAVKAKELSLGLNAGHDLDLQNLKFFKDNIPWLNEVSIGHALICDAVYLGLENTIQIYNRQLKV